MLERKASKLHEILSKACKLHEILAGLLAILSSLTVTPDPRRRGSTPTTPACPSFGFRISLGAIHLCRDRLQYCVNVIDVGFGAVEIDDFKSTSQLRGSIPQYARAAR